MFPDMRAGIYCRISRDSERDGLGVARQEKDCRQLAKRRGWDVAAVFVDNDVSAYSGKARPEYGRLVEAIKNREVDVVVAWHGDRLHRHPRELEDFIDVLDATGALVATVSGADFDLSTSDGRAMARVVGAFSRKESEDKSRRLKAKHLQLAEAGRMNGGGRAFGFNEDRRTVRGDEADYVREAAGRVLAGETLRGVCRDWNTRGVATVTGKPWTTTVLRRILTAGRTCGWREHHGDLVAAGDWTAILDRATVDRLRRILLDPHRRTSTARSPRYLLSGVARCGRCGGKMVGRPREDKTPRYVCPTGPGFTGCGKTFVLAGPLDELVAEMVFEAVDGPEFDAALRALAAESAGHDPADDLGDVENRLEELAAMWAAGEIGRPEWMAARKPLEARAEAARRQLAHQTGTGALDGFHGQPGALRDAWGTLPVERRRAIVASVLEAVTVGPGRRGYNRFDPARFTPIWRF